VKRFTFRLDRLRELRERAERERAAQLGLAMRKESERQDTLAAAMREADRAGEQAALAPSRVALPAGLLSNLDLARGTASLRVDDAEAQLLGASEAVEQERVRYGEARRDLRVIEKLKEKRFDAWKDDAAREEQKETDGLAQNRRTPKEDRP
jgi:flagellar FliJ protein